MYSTCSAAFARYKRKRLNLVFSAVIVASCLFFLSELKSSRYPKKLTKTIGHWKGAILLVNYYISQLVRAL